MMNYTHTSGPYQTKTPTKGQLAEKLMFIVLEVTSQLLKEEQNAIYRNHQNKINGVWNNYLQDLTNQKSPVLYIDFGAEVRMRFYKHKLIIIQSGNMPSKIPGKSVEEVWENIKDEYNPTITTLINELNIDSE